MKKSYTKPLVYCENHKTGVVVSNSEEYEKKMKRKLAEMKDKYMEAGEEVEINKKEEIRLSI